MAVVDSSVIIHLARIGKLNLLQSCFKKISISAGIEQEIIKEDKTAADEIRNVIGKWIEVKKGEVRTSRGTGFLSAADIELIELARKEKDFILTNDGEIISSAKSRGVKTADFRVIRNTVMPAILVEGGFLTHEEEGRRCQDPLYQNALAWGIAQGIHDYTVNVPGAN